MPALRGYDFHDRSVRMARQRAAEAGLGDRIHFEPLDATSYPAERFDLICMLDTLHDLGDPAAALAHARMALASDSVVLAGHSGADIDVIRARQAHGRLAGLRRWPWPFFTAPGRAASLNG